VSRRAFEGRLRQIEDRLNLRPQRIVIVGGLPYLHQRQPIEASGSLNAAAAAR
jgi:hypothetical protein